ncbi:hypothetical protein K2X05_13175, partial [bacterium]|nr:hypothetical protein [bacterium]
SRIPGYEHISSADEIRREMAKNPMLQLEMGLGVLEMKRVDHKLSGENIKPILEGYLSSSDSNNQDYADSIYACANCVKNNNFSFSLKCLCDAKPDDDKCIDTASGGIPKCTK